MRIISAKLCRWARFREILPFVARLFHKKRGKGGGVAEYLKLIGIVIIVVGFACKLDSILVIMVAAIATALEAVVEHPEGDIAGVGGGSEH